MNPYHKELTTLDRGKEFSQLEAQKIQTSNGLEFEKKNIREDTDQKITILAKGLTLFDLGLLPNELFDLIITYLNPSDLGALSKTNAKSVNLEPGWVSVANRIACSLNPLLSTKEQIQVFISKLKQKVTDRPNLGCEEVSKLLKSNQVDDLRTLQKLLEVRDTQIVWKKLAESIRQTERVPLTLTKIEKIEHLLEISQQFKVWWETHQISLSQLTTLHLSNNQLTSLPTGIGSLTLLTYLDLSYNQLTYLPTEIGSLTLLTDLYLYNNQLTSLPGEIGKLTQLTALNSSNNQLTTLPTEICNLTRLARLPLQGNKLTSLPTEIGNLTLLTRLVLDNNQLSPLPIGISNLTRLRELRLGGNQLTCLPTWISNLTQLRDLNLNQNQLTSLPTWINNLAELITINLEKNQLTSLPTEIGNLTKLVHLKLNENQLASLPTEIGSLTKLTIINLEKNQLIS